MERLDKRNCCLPSGLFRFHVRWRFSPENALEGFWLSNTQNYEQFRAAIDEWLPLLTHSHISYLALKADGVKNIVLLRVILHAGLFPLPYVAFRHESDQLLCRTLNRPLPKDWLDTLITGARQGNIDLRPGIFRFPLKPPREVNYHFNRDSALEVDEYRMRVPGLEIYGSDLEDLTRGMDLRALDWEIRSGQRAFQGHRQLLNRLGFRRDLFGVSSPTVEIVVLPPGAIRPTSKMTKGHADVEARLSPRSKIHDFTLTYASKEESSAKQELAGSTHSSWNKGKQFDKKIWKLPTGDHSQIDIFLNFRSQTIHHVTLRDDHKFLNPYLLAFECYDPDSKAVRQLIGDAKKDTIGFEIGVSLLLGSLGFSVSTHGAVRKIQQGPDILAFVPGKKAVLVIECTIGILSANDKLSKLHERTVALRKQFSESAYSDYEVHPLIVSALPNERLTVDLVTAHEHGISVASKELLDAWLEQHNEFPDPKKLYKTIVNLVPHGGGLGSIMSGSNGF